MRTVELRELADVTVGHVGPMQTEYRSDGVPFLRSQNVRPHRIDPMEMQFIGAEFHHGLRKSALRPGDVVIVRTGKPGTAAVIPEWLPEANCSDLVIVRPGAQLDAHWLSYYINASAQSFVNAHLVGAVQQHFNVGSAKQMRLPLLTLSAQRAIAEVLGALDDKIAANSRLVGATKALLAGRLAASADEGVNMVALGDVARFHNNRRVPLSSRQRDDRRGNVPYWGANGVLDYVDEALFNEPLVLVGEDGSVQDESGRPIVHYVWGPTWVNNHAHVLTGVGISTELLRYVVEAGNVAHLVTGAVQPKLSMGNLKRLELRIPTDLRPIERLCAVLQKRLVAASMESDQLANLRDTLLPHLMSGRISVRGASKAVEEVL